MADGIEEQLKALDQTTLTPLVRSALGRGGIEVGDWQCRPVFGGVEMASSLYRFSGDAEAGGGTIPWTLILKIAQAPPGDSDDPQGVRYWKREALAYQSGRLRDLPERRLPGRKATPLLPLADQEVAAEIRRKCGSGC